MLFKVEIFLMIKDSSFLHEIDITIKVIFSYLPPTKTHVQGVIKTNIFEFLFAIKG